MRKEVPIESHRNKPLSGEFVLQLHPNRTIFIRTNEPAADEMANALLELVERREGSCGDARRRDEPPERIVRAQSRARARAGVVQAFIIAFYAEMYGFPITIYALTRFFGLDVAGPFWDQNLWIYLTGTPVAMLVSMTIGYGIAFFGVALVSGGWREVHRARKEDRMAVDGPYAVVRHPQYTGLFLIVFGEGVVHWPTVFSLAGFPLIVLAYVALARKEERQMMNRFGEEYIDYRRRVPMFVPRRSEWHQLTGGCPHSGGERRTWRAASQTLRIGGKDGWKFVALGRADRVSHLLLLADAIHAAWSLAR